MCSNYVPVTRSDRLLRFFGVHRDPKGDTMPVDTWPSGVGPFLRLAEDGSGNELVLDDGRFGLVPPARMEMARGKQEMRIDKRGFYNARTETVHQLPSFKKAWAAGHRCIIPAESFYEPNYESGGPVRWRISRPHDIPMAIAGIYRWSTFADGSEGWSFAMLTVNADQHPLMKRFHAPGEEKRMVVLLDPEEYGPWLQCPVDEAKMFCDPWDGELQAEPAPLIRVVKAASVETVAPKEEKSEKAPKPPRPPKVTKPKPPAPPTTGDLF